MLVALSYHTRMSHLLEWLPLIAFFVTFKLAGIYPATAVLMAACVIQLVGHRLRTGKFKDIHVAVTAAALALGAATLLLHDKRFIQLKPTVIFWGMALAFLGSLWIGRRPLAQRMLEGAVDIPLTLSPSAWTRLNLLWVLWFAALGGLNLYIAAHFSESVWVNFKVFGISAAMLVFMLPQVFWLYSRHRAPS
jgi:intracellular septation protein